MDLLILKQTKKKNKKDEKTSYIPTSALTDTPAKHGEISLDVEGYLEGFANFIKECDTPMTVAIQGDWGTGKTTAMEYLTWNLEGKPQQDSNDTPMPTGTSRDIVLSFNTWQYSQFNLGDQLAYTLLLGIFSQLHQKVDGDKDSEESNRVRDALVKIMRCSVPLLGAAANMAGLGAWFNALKDTAQEARKETPTKNDKDILEDNTPVKALTELKSAFEQYIWKVACRKPDTADEDKKYRKIYIMIDDLDRLNPARAVEVMEALKIFLNVKHCVFVMAIDFNVVLRGVKDKYGEDFGEDKARAFFDKIIQIPFNLPTGAYQLTPYVKQCVAKQDKDNDELIGKYVDYLQCTVGTNPRSIKRIFNTFKLMDDIAAARNSDGDSGNDIDNSDRAGTFAILCFQNGYPRVFEDLMFDMGAGVPSTDYIQGLQQATLRKMGSTQLEETSDAAATDSNADVVLDQYSRKFIKWGYEDYQIALLSQLLTLMVKEFNIPESGMSETNQEDYANQMESAENRLQQALTQAAVTSVRTNTGSDQAILGTREMNADERRRSYMANDNISPEQRELLGVFEDALAKEGFTVSGVDQPRSSKIAFKANKDNKTIIPVLRGVQFMVVNYPAKNHHLRINFGNKLTRSGNSPEKATQLRDAWIEQINQSIKEPGSIKITRSPADKPDPIHINQITTSEQINALVPVLVSIATGNSEDYKK